MSQDWYVLTSNSETKLRKMQKAVSGRPGVLIRDSALRFYYRLSGEHLRWLSKAATDFSVSFTQIPEPPAHTEMPCGAKVTNPHAHGRCNSCRALKRNTPDRPPPPPTNVPTEEPAPPSEDTGAILVPGDPQTPQETSAPVAAFTDAPAEQGLGDILRDVEQLRDDALEAAGRFDDLLSEFKGIYTLRKALDELAGEYDSKRKALVEAAAQVIGTLAS